MCSSDLVISRLGALDDVNPAVIENLFACDLNYLHKFYLQVNELEEKITEFKQVDKNVNGSVLAASD